MKVTYLQEDKKKNTTPKAAEKVKVFKSPEFYLSKRDYEIFNRYEDLHNAKYGHTFIPFDHIHSLLHDRKNVKSLSITPEEASSNKYIKFTYGEDLYNKLKQEANKLKIDIDDYIRGIVYSRTMELLDEKRLRDKEIEEWQEDNRTIFFNINIERDLRKKLEAKYGDRADDEYEDLIYKIINDDVAGAAAE
ncbi:hypothetical protein CBU02nite_37950 [Clostridium butyricum]|uniref:Uncharacterized protein n=1 Tax=Clostridium butyricum TaxID=1492 RepID=A0A512TSS1_CLOBU|nr:hypothetical protein [Clostridium butyricum]NOW25511.1 hypothetical protein [Clostridium butyricum]GEQ23289.1 hypothetical protein CBU02nite_37950 [Clostridium butyricum]